MTKMALQYTGLSWESAKFWLISAPIYFGTLYDANSAGDNYGSDSIIFLRSSSKQSIASDLSLK